MKVQHALSRSKGQAWEFGSSLGKRLEVTQPALHRIDPCRMGIQHQACIFIKHCSWNTNKSIFGPLADSFPSHPSWHRLNKHPLNTKVVVGNGYEIYLHVMALAAAYGGIADQVARGVTLQECFPLTKSDARQSVRLCSYRKTKGCLLRSSSMSHFSGIISDKTWVHSIRVSGMTTTAVLVELFSTEWIDRHHWISEWIKEQKRCTLLVSTGWTMGLCQYFCVSACACKESGMSFNHWLYLFGHFHCAWYFTWYVL